MQTWALDPLAARKTVYYEGSSTIYPYMPVCYNYDTTNNWTGASVSATGVVTETGTTAEGLQNEGKFIRVENPATANFAWFAGVVAPGSYCNKVGPAVVEIIVPNGAVVPVRTNLSTTVGVTPLALGNAVQYLTSFSGSTPVVGIAMETVDRSGTAGVVLARLFASTGGVTAVGGAVAPTRYATTGDFYGVRFDVSGALTGAGTGGPRSWGVGITGDKTSGEVTVAGADDAGLRINISCRTINTSVFNFRGLNCAVTCGNSSGSDPGYVGELDNTISTATKGGSTSTTQIGLVLTCENYGTVGTTFGGLKIDLRNEGTVATDEYGIHVTNTNDSVAGPVNTVIKVDDTSTHGVNTGFTYFLYVPTAADLGVIAASGDITFTSADKLIPVRIGSTTYYLVATDNV